MTRQLAFNHINLFVEALMKEQLNRCFNSNNNTLLHMSVFKSWPLGIVIVPLIILLLGTFSSDVQAQTPGLIYKPALNGGNNVLDPNGDGYASASSTGFVSNDETESEIPFRRVPVLESEPSGDTKTGATGGHTDYGDHPFYTYFDGTNIFYRMRLSGQSTSSKGYSVLIDSDNTYSGIGPNPGFEFEVLLATNFSLQIIDHRVSPSTVIFTGNLDQHFQKSIALTRSHGDTDYFYDMYVPLSAFNGAITASTPLRMVLTSVTSAQSSAISGTYSDVGGADDRLYGFDKVEIWNKLIRNFPSTSLTTSRMGPLTPPTAAAPVVNNPIKVGASTISGTSGEAAGSTINVLRNGVSICGGAGQPGCPTVGTDGRWTLSGIASNLLVAGDVITAIAIVNGKSNSQPSAGVTVSNLTSPPCSTPAPTNLSIPNHNGSFLGTTSYSGAQTIRIYQNNSSTVYASVVWNTLSGFNWNIDFTGKIPNGSYTATVTPTNGGCESPHSISYCHGVTKLPNGPTITSTNLTTIDTEVRGTIPTTDGYTIYLYVNGRQVAQRSFAAGSSPSSWSIPFSGFNAGDAVYVRATSSVSTCLTDPTASVIVTQAVTASPAITGSYNGTVTAVNGTSTEAAGTSVQVFYTPEGSSTPVSVGTTTVNSSGLWSLAVAPGVIPVRSTLTAVATAINKQQSPPSAPVTVGDVTSNANLTVTGPIIEGSSSVRGTYLTPGAVIKVYIEGIPLVTSSPIIVASNGTWSVSGLLTYELFAGARVTATAQIDPNAESVPSAEVVVTCLQPVQQSVTATSTAVCVGSVVTIQLGGSERGIYYDLYGKPAGSSLTPVKTGVSVAGNGGPVILTSNPITENTTFSVVATKISRVPCSVTFHQTPTVNVNALPVQGASLVSGPAGVCANSTANITVTNTNTNYRYQLRTGTTPVGSPVTGVANGGTITLPTNPITVTTTFNVFVTDVITGCSVQFSPGISISPTGPSAMRSVTASASSICLGGTVDITVATESNNNYSYQIQQSINSQPFINLGSPENGTGNTFFRTSGPHNTEGSVTYRVVVSNPNTACTSVILLSQPTVRVSNAATTADAGAAQILCGVTTASLNGNSPLNGTGAWSIVSTSPTDPSPTVTVETPSSPTSQVLGMKQGYTYTFRWTITLSCGGQTSSSSSTTTITTNCPSVYTLTPAKFPSQYKNGELLAALSDVDGGIQSAALIDGTDVPLGTTFNTQTGAITVSDHSSLIAGTYTFRVSALDARGIATILNVTLSFYGEIPRGAPLPVELVSFSAKAVAGGIRLDWRTASERNNDHFLLQRSINGSSFSTIATIEGNGSSNKIYNYTHTDYDAAAGTNYYRLVQVDYDGTETKSHIVTAVSTALATRLNVYPNPVQDVLSIDLPSLTAPEQVNVTVQDIRGIRLIDIVKSGDETNKLELDLSQLRAGIYLLIIEGPSINRQVSRIIKLH